MEFNTGKPPAGEAGMCVTFHTETASHPQFWNGEFFKDSSPCFISALTTKFKGGQNRRWRWATLSELTAAGISEDEARKMVHRSQLPETPFVVGNRPDYAGMPADENGWHDWHEGDTVPACDRVDVIRVTAGIKGAAESQVDDVVVTSQYWGPNSFVRKWRPAVAKPAADPNAKMVAADGAKQPVAYRFWEHHTAGSLKAMMTAYRDAAVSRQALVERPFDHRLGNFN